MKQAVILFLGIMLSCAPKLSDNRRMFNTVKKATYCISDLDYDCISKLSAYDLSNNGNGGLKYQIKSAHYYLKKYHNNQIDSLIFKRDTVSDNMGRLKYTIYLFEGFDSLTGVSHAELQIFVGPKNVFDLDKISDLRCEEVVDPEYRKHLRLSGKLLDMDKLLETLR